MFLPSVCSCLAASCRSRLCDFSSDGQRAGSLNPEPARYLHFLPPGCSPGAPNIPDLKAFTYSTQLPSSSSPSKAAAAYAAPITSWSLSSSFMSRTPDFSSFIERITAASFMYLFETAPVPLSRSRQPSGPFSLTETASSQSLSFGRYRSVDGGFPAACILFYAFFR